MSKKVLLMMLLMAVFAPWAANAQSSLCDPADQCNISYALVDSYGDGWNGGQLEIVDATASATIATLTISSGSSLNGSLAVCVGHELQFIYTTGSWAGENSWTIYDVTGAVIWQGSGSNGNQTFDYTVVCPTCLPPTALNATLTPGNGTIATLTWTAGGSETNWVLEYGTAADFTGATSVNANRPSVDLTGLTPETTYYARVKANCGDDGESNWSNTLSFTPTDLYAITVNDGTDTNPYVPYYAYYHDSQQRSEFIIPASGLQSMKWGTITSMKLYPNYTYTTNATIKVYLMEVVERTFSDVTFYTEADATVVYDGTLTISPAGLTIDFGEGGFEYYGGNLLVGFYQATGGSGYYSSSSCPFYGVDSEGGSISQYSSYSGLRDFLPKTTFTFEPGEEPSCYKPSGLAVNNIYGRAADVTWTPGNEETAWQVEVTGEYATTWDATEIPFTLVGLEPETDYSVRVRANCGEGDYSEWTNPVTFTTDVACPAPKNLLVDEITAYTAHVSWLSNAEMYDLRYVSLPGERRGTYPTRFADLFTQNSTSTSNYQLEADPNAQPNANTRVEQFRDGWYGYDNGTYATSFGWGGSIFWGSMFPAGSFTETMLTKIALYETSANNTQPITLIVCAGGDTIPENIIYTETFEPEGANAFHEVALTSPVNVDPSQNLWIVFYQTGDTYPAAACTDTGEANNRWITPNGNVWYDLNNVGGSGYGWLIRAYLITFDPSTANWTEVNNLQAFEYDITGLDPETEYIVQVRSNCGSDGYSEWTSKLFTTEPTCVMPTDLDVTDFTAHTATLSWTDPNGATAWDVEVTNNDEWPAIVTTWNATTNPYTVNGLQGNTHYSFKVRAKCSDTDFSDWSEAVVLITDIACTAPNNLMVIDSTITAFSAHLTWVSEAETTDLRYMVNAGNTGDSWLSYDDGTYATNIGSSAGDERTWAVMYPASMLGSNNTLTMLSIFEDSYIESDITVRIYQGGDTIPELQIYREIISPVGGSFYGFHDVALSEAVTIDPSKNLWISLTATGPYVIPACESTEINNKWLYNAANGWYHFTGSLADYGWMIRAGFATMNWVNVPDLTENEYELTELLPETDYIAQVRSNCNVEGEGFSTWSSVEFTTLPSCWTPSNVVVSGVEYTQAIVNWTPNTNGTETAWQIELSDDQEPPVVTIYDVTAHPDTLVGLFDDTEYTVRVRANCGVDDYSDWTNPVTFTTLSLCEAPVIDSITNIEATSASLYWTGIQDAYNVRIGVADPTVILNVDFEDGEIPTSFTNGTTGWIIIADTVAEDNSYFIASSNYNVSSSTATISMTATYEAEGTIEFYSRVSSESVSWDYGTFLIDGTEMLREGGTTPNTWTQRSYAVSAGTHTFTWKYTKDSSVNSGEDRYYIDNIVLSLTNYVWEPVIENIEDVTYNLTGLTPETEYIVQVQGQCPRGLTEWSDMVTFTTLEQTMLTQTIELAAGSNYVSFYVETTLADLKAALAAATPTTTISIKSQTGTTTYNPNNHRWTGNITLDLGKMYIINVSEAAEIVLEGMPLDPASLSVTITGTTYLGFPFSESMTPADAFAGFAVQGDKIKSQNATCAYNRGRWGTQIPALEPGKGYKYVSSGSEERPFTYPASK